MIDKKTVADTVFEALKHSILTGAYQPGNRIKENEVKEKLGVSRTPVREAFRRLAASSLVRIEAYKGAVVQDVSHEHHLQIYEVRRGLDGLAAYLAAQRIKESQVKALASILVVAKDSRKDMEEFMEQNIRFHQGVIEASGNMILLEYSNHILGQLQLVRGTTLAVPGRVQDVLNEHHRVLQAISEGDAHAAQVAAEEHIDRALANLQRLR